MYNVYIIPRCVFDFVILNENERTNGNAKTENSIEVCLEDG